MKTKKKIAIFQKAIEEGKLVCVCSLSAPKDRLDGYVVGLSDQFVLLHIEDGGYQICLNGYSVVPLEEVKQARVQDDYNSILHRALTLKGHTPVVPQNVDLTDFATLIASIDAHFPLTTLHCDYLYPDSCYIGRVAKLTEKSVTLREITPAAEWKNVNKYRFKDITRIDFGGGYEDALWRVSEDERRKQKTDQL